MKLNLTPHGSQLTALQLIQNCRDQHMPKIAQRVQQLANARSVLIFGETGAGKELIARALHECGERSQASLVILDCTNFRGDTLRSELFGHIKGAFTGATDSHTGLFEKANGGTAFLDEVGEIPYDEQPRLLRVLQEGTFTRLGGNCEQKSDFRLVAATNRDLKQMVANGTFRQDLFYRLNTFTIAVPPLWQRVEDVLRLANHFLDQFSGDGGKILSSSAEEALQKHGWPGNVRELRSAIERAVTMTGDREEVTVEDLELGPSSNQREIVLGEAMVEIIKQVIKTRPPTGILDELERLAITHTVATAENFETASAILGIDQATLYRKRKKFGLK